mmetsp:Transcript_1153/g.2881  ORF Transcript_1153/g.2881 Transcript_1153/m.2881 type:complete len:351 (-) Transcript_1153:288-1340(-)
MLLHQAPRLAGILDAAATEHGAVPVVMAQQFKKLDARMSFFSGPEATRTLVLRVIDDGQITSLPGAAGSRLEAPGVAARHADDGPLRNPSLDGGITATELCESLFQQYCPNFLSVGVRVLSHREPIDPAPHTVGGPALHLAGHVVVDDEGLPVFLLRVVQLDVVLASRVHLWGQEEGADGALVLGERGHGGEEPAVAESALQDVRGLDTALEEAHVGVVQVRVRRAVADVGFGEIHGSDPSHVGLLLASLGVGEVPTHGAQRGGLGRKLRVREVRRAASKYQPEQATAIDTHATKAINADGVNDQNHRSKDDVVQKASSAFVEIRPTAEESIHGRALLSVLAKLEHQSNV